MFVFFLFFFPIHIPSQSIPLLSHTPRPAAAIIVTLCRPCPRSLLQVTICLQPPLVLFGFAGYMQAPRTLVSFMPNESKSYICRFVVLSCKFLFDPISCLGAQQFQEMSNRVSRNIPQRSNRYPIERHDRIIREPMEIQYRSNI